MSDRDFLHAKGLATFSGQPTTGVYQKGSGFDTAPDVSGDLDHSAEPSTPTNYKEVRSFYPSLPPSLPPFSLLFSLRFREKSRASSFLSHLLSLPPSLPPSLLTGQEPPRCQVPPLAQLPHWCLCHQHDLRYPLRLLALHPVRPSLPPSLPPTLPPSFVSLLITFSSYPPRQARHFDTHIPTFPHFPPKLISHPTPPSLPPSLSPFLPPSLPSGP